MLHITNGDSVLGSFEQIDLPGEKIAWRDVLHEGPVPRMESLAALSEVRSWFLAKAGAGPYAELRASFAERDQALESCGAHEEVVLWFEHDLYDQLQLIQILDWFAQHRHPCVTLINPDRYLGEMIPGELMELFPGRQRVNDGCLRLARDAWSAFTAPDVRALPEFLRRADFSPLPFLRQALRRLIEEYPSERNGLSRTQRETLEAIAGGCREKAAIFLFVQNREEPRFLGDWSVFREVDLLVESGALTDSRELTGFGSALLRGDAHLLRDRSTGRWVGGVHF